MASKRQAQRKTRSLATQSSQWYIFKTMEKQSLDKTGNGEDSRLTFRKNKEKEMLGKNDNGIGTISMRISNSPKLHNNCRMFQSATMMNEQCEPKQSFVCIYLNFESKYRGNKGHKSGSYYRDRPEQIEQIRSAPLSGGKLPYKIDRKHSLPGNGDLHSRARNVAPSSSRSSDGAIWRHDHGSSTTQSGQSNSTSPSTSRRTLSASPRPGILREALDPAHSDKRTSGRVRRPVSISPPENSRSETSSPQSREDGRQAKRYTRRRKGKRKCPSPRLRKSRTSVHEYRDSGERHRSKVSRKHSTSSRSGSRIPTTRTSSGSGMSFESFYSSSISEPEFLEPEVKFISGKDHADKNIECESNVTETVCCKCGKVKNQRANYIQDNLRELQLFSLDNDHTNEICSICKRGRGDYSKCVCLDCPDTKRAPTCLYCSRCYIIPCVDNETSDTPKSLRLKRRDKSPKRRKHPHKRSHKHHRSVSQRRAKRDQGDTHVGVDRGSNRSGFQYECSSSYENCMPDDGAQFYQCDLRLGQRSLPTTGSSLSTPLTDSNFDETTNRRDSNSCHTKNATTDNPSANIAEDEHR